MNKIKVIRAKCADTLEQKVNEFYREYGFSYTTFLTKGKEFIAIVSRRDINAQEEAVENALREIRANQDYNQHRFQDLESAIYKLTDKFEKIEGKKEKQHKILHD